MNYLNQGIDILFDLLESLGVAVAMICLAPFLLVKCSLNSLASLSIHLLPLGFFAAYLRAKLSQRLGNVGGAAAIYDQILKVFEGAKGIRPQAEHLLSHMYQELMACYLRMGHFEQAVNLVLRANSHLGCDGVSGFPELNIGAAHIIKAGLAAGRFIEEQDLKDILESGRPFVIHTQKPADILRDKMKASDRDAKIIPFPTPDRPR